MPQKRHSCPESYGTAAGALGFSHLGGDGEGEGGGGEGLGGGGGVPKLVGGGEGGGGLGLHSRKTGVRGQRHHFNNCP